MLEGFEGDNIFLNTAVIETLTAYDFLEPPVSLDTATSEFKMVIGTQAPFDASLIELAELTGVSPEQLLADRAYGLLTNIFEDVFQGVYSEAYSSLSESEKSIVLCRAANASRPGLFTDWVLRELFKYGGRNALPIYERFASSPDGESFSPQVAVAAFALGVEGCAKQRGVLPPFSENISPDIRAWRTIGEILFLCAQELPVPESIWDRFTGEVRLAAADIFYQLQHSHWRIMEPQKSLDLVSTFQRQTCPIIEECVLHRESLSSIFRHGGSRDANVVRFLVNCLGSIGGPESISVLTALADDQTFGKDAVASIEAIQRRLFPIGRSATP